jgi:hypothetical protein
MINQKTRGNKRRQELNHVGKYSKILPKWKMPVTEKAGENKEKAHH